MEIKIIIRNKIAKLAERYVVGVCGNSDYIINFDFDTEWDEYETKTARFKHSGTYIDVVFTGNKCNMPVIKDTYNVEIGVFAGDLHTTTSALLPMKKSILCGGGSPEDPAPDVYNQIMNKLNNLDTKGYEELNKEIGDLADLETEAKENLVAAINEAAKSGGESYTLPQATSEAIGGVKADSAEAADTQPVRIGTDGKLYTAPGVTDISTKMDANNPTGTGSFSMNRKAGTVIGVNSHAEGTNTTASGDSSHAEGHNTTASGNYSHAQGKYNIEDTSNIYADIIGNGTSDTARSNAATVDWNGNAWFAGDVYTGSTSGTNKDEGSKKLATEEYVNSSIAAGGTDISLGLTSAAVGQIIKVKAIDESGKPTAWEAADMPSGGGSSGGRTWELIAEGTITEETAGFSFDKDTNGEAFELSECYLYINAQPFTGDGGSKYSQIRINNNTVTTSLSADVGITRYFQYKCELMNGAILVTQSVSTFSYNNRFEIVNHSPAYTGSKVFDSVTSVEFTGYVGANTTYKLYGVRA